MMNGKSYGDFMDISTEIHWVMGMGVEVNGGFPSNVADRRVVIRTST